MLNPTLELDSPPVYRDFFIRVGGVNPFRKPMYRMVLAEKRRTLEGGNWFIWDENLSVAARGGFVEMRNELGDTELQQSTEQPLRIESGIREVLKYPSHEGWIIERWCPASTYGFRDEWENHTMPDGTLKLGPYPEYGDYEYCAGSSATTPSFNDIENTIRLTEFDLIRRATRANSGLAIIARLREAESKQLARLESAKAQYIRYLNERFNFLHSATREAGRLREGLAQNMRKRGSKIGHVGN